MELIRQVNEKLEAGFIPASAILAKFQLGLNPPYYLTDPTYLPFYLYLGQFVNPINLLEVGFESGLVSGSFLLSCKSVENFLGFQQVGDKVHYSTRFGQHNLALCYRKNSYIHFGSLSDSDFITALSFKKWDLVLINSEYTYDEYLFCFRSIWPNIADDGLLILDKINSHKPARLSFYDFAKISNREVLSFKSKYQASMIIK